MAEWTRHSTCIAWHSQLTLDDLKKKHAAVAFRLMDFMDAWTLVSDAFYHYRIKIIQLFCLPTACRQSISFR